MRSSFILVAVVAAVTACESDSAHHAVHLPAPYDSLPPDQPIEAGKPIALSAQQQEAVVVAVTKWMKDPRSVQFSDMHGARTPRGQVVVCGRVMGRNSVGRYVGLSPFIGVLKEADRTSDFIVVSIAASERERSEVLSLCRQSGVEQTG
jgi:hypothetical protein